MSHNPPKLPPINWRRRPLKRKWIYGVVLAAQPNFFWWLFYDLMHGDHMAKLGFLGAILLVAAPVFILGAYWMGGVDVYDNMRENNDA